MKLLIMFMFVFISTMSFAEVQLGYGHNITTVNNLEKKLDLDSYNGLQFFYNWSDLSVGTELNYFHTSQRDHNLISMSLNYYEAIAWVRYNFINLTKFNLYFSTGVGGYLEKLKVNVADSNIEETSEPQLLLPAALGANYTFYKKVSLGVEYRIIRKVEAEYENYSLRTSLSYIF